MNSPSESCYRSIIISPNSVRRQLSVLRRKIGTNLRPVHSSYKIKDVMKVPPIESQQYALYHCNCDLCDSGYILAANGAPASPHRGAQEICHTSGESSIEKKTASICNWLIYLIPFLPSGTEGCDDCFLSQPSPCFARLFWAFAAFFYHVESI